MVAKVPGLGDALIHRSLFSVSFNFWLPVEPVDLVDSNTKDGVDEFSNIISAFHLHCGFLLDGEPLSKEKITAENRLATHSLVNWINFMFADFHDRVAFSPTVFSTVGNRYILNFLGCDLDLL